MYLFTKTQNIGVQSNTIRKITLCIGALNRAMIESYLHILLTSTYPVKKFSIQKMF